MKICCLYLFLCLLPAWAQVVKPEDVKPEDVKPETVVATVNGKSYTAADIDGLIATLPPMRQQVARRDPKAFLADYAWYDLIADMAEKSKVAEKSPYKEQIAEMRRQIIVQAQVNEYKNSLPIMPADQKKYYEANLDKYKETKVKMIFIPYAATPAADAKDKKPLTEAEAKTKAESVVKLARSGVDFVKLVKEHSEDPGTLSHDGDLGIGIRPSSTNVPENVKTAVLAMKQGDVSDAIKQANGYVVVRAESIAVAPYESVKDDIFKEMKDVEVRKLVDETRKKATVKIENNAYFGQQK